MRRLRLKLSAQFLNTSVLTVNLAEHHSDNLGVLGGGFKIEQN